MTGQFGQLIEEQHPGMGQADFSRIKIRLSNKLSPGNSTIQAELFSPQDIVKFSPVLTHAFFFVNVTSVIEYPG